MEQLSAVGRNMYTHTVTKQKIPSNKTYPLITKRNHNAEKASIFVFLYINFNYLVQLTATSRWMVSLRWPLKWVNIHDAAEAIQRSIPLFSCVIRVTMRLFLCWRTANIKSEKIKNNFRMEKRNCGIGIKISICGFEYCYCPFHTVRFTVTITNYPLN